MTRLAARLLGGGASDLRSRIIAIYLLLIAANIAAWAWALVAFHDFPLLLGTAVLAYSFGLRHAVDADHIAAIDNVTRKLMQEGKRPVSVGLYFSLGHSTIVILASAGVAGTAMAFAHQFTRFQSIGSPIGTSVSALFLLLIAVMNLLILLNICRAFQIAKAGGVIEEDQLNGLLAGRGFMPKIFVPLFGMIRKSWHMYPLGFLFGLGFDTATEVGVLGISAAGASKGLNIWSIMVFPALFTAGMSLVDTTDGILMLGAYGWALIDPIRKLIYNMAITAVSVAAALLVGGAEVLGMIATHFRLGGWFWQGIDVLNQHLGILGFALILASPLGWSIAAMVYRSKRWGTSQNDIAPGTAS